MKDIIPYFALLLFSAMLMMAIVFYTWKKRAIRGAWPLIILAMCGFFWTFGYAFEILGISFAWMLFWHHVKLIGMMFVATAVLYFTLEYAGHYQWTRRPIILFLFTVPFVVYMLNLVNAGHEWMYIGQPVVIYDIVPSLVFENNWLGWLNIQYNFFLIILSGFVLAHKYFYSAKIYRQQILVILLGVSLPFLGAALSLANFGRRFGVDYASFLVVISGLVICWGVFRYQLLDLVPVANTAVLASIQDGVVVVDASSRVIDINNAAAAFLNTSLQAALGQSVNNILPDWPGKEDDQLPCGEVMVRASQENGTEQYLEIRCKPLQTKRDMISGRLLIVHDVTDRKIAEKLLAEQKSLLEEEVAARVAEIHLVQEKSEIILQNVQDAIAMTDLDGRLNYVNLAFLNMTGYEEGEVLNMHAGELLSKRIPGRALAGIKQAIKQGGYWQGEVRIQGKDGRSYIADVLFASVKDKDGRLVGFVFSHRDISQQKDLEKARSQFINNISHELRTPVTNLKLYVQLLQTTKLSAKRNYYEQTLARQVERLEKLIQDVLEMSSLDLGDTRLNWQPVNVVDLIDNVIVQHRVDAEQKQLTMQHIPAQAAKTMVTQGDYAQLELAVCKLVDNAIRFTLEKGQIHIETTTMTYGGREWITVTIQDTGVGIANDEQRQIFNRFYRGKMSESGDIPGTGLGLSIAEHIIHLHGGSLAVESEVGEGSTFTLRIPKQ